MNIDCKYYGQCIWTFGGNRCNYHCDDYRHKDDERVTRCQFCKSYYAYANAKTGRGLCIHFMHEMPTDGYCSEHGKGDK